MRRPGGMESDRCLTRVLDRNVPKNMLVFTEQFAGKLSAPVFPALGKNHLGRLRRYPLTFLVPQVTSKLVGEFNV